MPKYPRRQVFWFTMLVNCIAWVAVVLTAAALWFIYLGLDSLGWGFHGSLIGLVLLFWLSFQYFYGMALSDNRKGDLP